MKPQRDSLGFDTKVEEPKTGKVSYKSHENLIPSQVLMRDSITNEYTDEDPELQEDDDYDMNELMKSFEPTGALIIREQAEEEDYDKINANEVIDDTLSINIG